MKMITNWLPEDFLKTIVLFELPNAKGVPIPHGTGVLINYKDVFVLVTCKHIVVHPQSKKIFNNLHATINTSDGSITRKNISAIHEQFKLKWFFHKNEDIDLAVSAIALDQGKDDFKLTPLELFEDFDHTVLGDDIFFLGYPFGLGASNVPKLAPLVRTGIIALKNTDKTFLIDANIYPGSSGSPVFYRPALAHKDGASMNIGSSRGMKFLGIVANYVPYIEEAVSLKTGRIRTIFEENSGLGTVFSASLVKEILESDEFQAIIPKTEKAQEESEKVTRSKTKNKKS